MFTYPTLSIQHQQQILHHSLHQHMPETPLLCFPCPALWDRVFQRITLQKYITWGPPIQCMPDTEYKYMLDNTSNRCGQSFRPQMPWLSFFQLLYYGGSGTSRKAMTFLNITLQKHSSSSQTRSLALDFLSVCTILLRLSSACAF